MAYPHLYQVATAPFQPGELAQDYPPPPAASQDVPPKLVRCPGAPLPDVTKDLPLAFGRIVAISGPVRPDGKVPLPVFYQPRLSSKSLPPPSLPAVVVAPPKPVGSSIIQKHPGLVKQKPASNVVYPSTRPFQKGSSVSLIDGRRGFVKDVQTLPDGQVIYYVYIICPDDRPPSLDLMLTCFDDDLDPPDISWLSLTLRQKWWISRLDELPSDPESRKEMLYWQTPASGWPAGSVVSVPLGDFGRQCAKVIEHLSDGFTVIEFPVVKSNLEKGVRGRLSTSFLSGHSVYWTLGLYHWHHAVAPVIDDSSSSASSSKKRGHDNDSSAYSNELPPLKLSCPPPESFLRDDIDF